MSRTIHLHSGNIIVDATKEKRAHSVTFIAGRVAAIDGEAPQGSLSIDLAGQTLLPGLIDSHLHMTLGSTGAGDVNLAHCSCRENFEALLLEHENSLQPDQWLIASGWSEHALGETPTIDWVNCIKDRPVLCWRTDFHAAILNDEALRCLHLQDISEVVGGEQCKHGVIKETALWEHVIPVIPKPTEEQMKSRLQSLAHSLHADGITLVGTMEHLIDAEQFLFPLRHALSIRMRLMVFDKPSAMTFERCHVLDDSFLKVTGFKTFIDGTLGSRTAKMYAQYCDVESTGLFVEYAQDNELQQWVDRVVQGGFAPVMHAIGDHAVGVALSSLTSVDQQVEARIEHAQFIDRQNMKEIDGQWFGVQPLHKSADDAIAVQAVGVERAKHLHDWRAMLDQGAKLSFGSDWPIAPHTPIEAMSAAIRAGVSVREALVATTAGAADSLREPRAGRLDIGCYADATMVDCDPFDCDWSRALPTILMTIVNGELQYEKVQKND